MNMKYILPVFLMMAMLMGCAPSDQGNDEPLPSPTTEIMTEVESTPAPDSTDTEEYLVYTYRLADGEESIYARRHHSAMGYSMIYDPFFLAFEKRDGADLYTAEEKKDHSNVYIKITKEITRTVPDLVSDLKKNGAEESDGLTLGGYEAQVLHNVHSGQPNDTVLNYYVVQAGDAVYVIERSCFFAAEEFYGQPMMQMIDTITFADASTD